MTTAFRLPTSAASLLLILSLIFLSFPRSVSAASKLQSAVIGGAVGVGGLLMLQSMSGGAGSAAGIGAGIGTGIGGSALVAGADLAGTPNARCVAWQASRTPSPPPPCVEFSIATMGPITGICVPYSQFCKGLVAPGLGGGSIGLGGGLGTILGILGGASAVVSIINGVRTLTGGGGSGGSGGGGIIYQPPPVICPNGYYNVSIATSTDPCAIYNPNPLTTGSSGLGTAVSDALINALGTTPEPPPVSTLIKSNAVSSTNTTTQGTKATTTVAQPQTQNVVTAANTVQLQPSLSGAVRLGGNGATVVANLKEGASEVAGFFGGSTFGGGGAQSAASRMCASRPWAGGGFIASFVPDAFLDSLCSRAGYQVGMLQQQQTALKPTQTNVTQKSATPSSQGGVNLIPPEADIWAEPTSVRLGTRAYIFWNARGVVSCTGAGPSFSLDGVSGGASTVPITGPTTFSIECVAQNGAKVSDTVTVQLKI